MDDSAEFEKFLSRVDRFLKARGLEEVSDDELYFVEQLFVSHRSALYTATKVGDDRSETKEY